MNAGDYSLVGAALMLLIKGVLDIANARRNGHSGVVRIHDDQWRSLCMSFQEIHDALQIVKRLDTSIEGLGRDVAIAASTAATTAHVYNEEIKESIRIILREAREEVRAQQKMREETRGER